METWRLKDETCNYRVIYGIKTKIYARIWEWRMAYLLHILVDLIILSIHLNESNVAPKWKLIINATFQVTPMLY